MGKNLKSLRVHLVKKLQLDQKLTKTSKNQIKLKQKKTKSKPKEQVKTKQQEKNLCQKRA